MAFTIEQGKETGLVQINVVPKSLVLCQLQAVNPVTNAVDSGSDTTYLCTTPDEGSDVRVWNGQTWQARLKSNVIGAIQALSAQGFDIPGSITLEIADDDFAIWNSHFNPNGLRGGTLTAWQVLWDAGSGTYSTNAYMYKFVLDKPNIDASGLITVAAQAQSLTRLSVPNFARQNRCGYTFPTNAAQRLDGLTNPTSLYWSCGYSPDLASIGGVGNQTTPNLINADGSQLTDSAGNYVMCDLTRSCGAGKGTLTQGCMARLGNYSATVFFGTSIPCASDGDLIDDESGRRTGHFSGDTFLTPVEWSGKQYVNPGAGKQYGFNTPNPATGQSYHNQGYGTQWVAAIVLAPAGDPNSDRAECVVCLAPVSAANILKVVANGVEVTQDNSDQLFTYRILTTGAGTTSLGGRNGTVNVDAIYNGQGDPHGGMCWFEIVVPAELAGPGSVLSVLVLTQFPQCLHAMPIATAAVSGSDTLLMFAPNVTNVDVGAGVVYVKGNSSVPDGAYSVVAAGFGPPGSITISGVSVNGTGGAVFYYPDNAADQAMVDATGAAAANPAWALMDLLTQGPYTVADFRAQTWYDAAQVCAAQISYTDINGNAATHARFRCSFALQNSNRQSLAKAVLGVRTCAGLILARNPADGLMDCYVEQSLADQQPLPIPGSNYNVPIPSVTAAGNATLGSNITSGASAIPLSYAMRLVTGQVIQIEAEQMQVTAGAGTSSLTVTRGFAGTTAASHVSGVPVEPCGYPAYLFDGAGSIELGTFKLGGRNLNDTPNTVSFPFQDSANQWVQDSITTVDDNGYITSGSQEIAAPLQILGIESFDQGTRMSNYALAKALYGNTRFDAGGTELPAFRTTAKASHLAARMGFICLVNYEQMSLSMELCRVLSASPQTDAEHWDHQFQLHHDDFNTDSYLQDPAPYQRNPQLTLPNRAPYPWQPGLSPWGPHDALFSSAFGFSVKINTANSPSTLDVYGIQPVNAPPSGHAPQCPLEATVSLTGGLISSGTYLIAIAASASGPVSPYFIRAVVPAGTTTASIVVSGIVWQEAAPAIGIYIGGSSLTMRSLDSAFWSGSTPDTYGNPTTFTLVGSAGPTGTGLPDPVFNSFLVQAKSIIHGGVWGAAASSVGSSGGFAYATFPGAGWTAGQWAGYILSCYAPTGVGGVGSGLGTLPLNFVVASNTSDTLTFAGAYGPAAGVAVVMRAKATSITANTIGDANFVNSFAPSGMTVNAEAGTLLMIIDGPGSGQPPATIASNTNGIFTIQGSWSTMPDSTSTYITVAPGWSYSVTTGTVMNDGTGTSPLIASLPVVNFLSGALLIEVLTVDANGNWSVERYAPIREIYIPATAVPGSSVSPGYFTITPRLNGIAPINLANGLKQRLVLPTTGLSGAITAGATGLVVNTTVVDNTACPFTFYWDDGSGEAGTCSAISGSTWTISAAANAHANAAAICTPVTMGAPSGSIAAGGSLNLYFDQPAAGSCPVPAFTGGTGGFAGDTQARIVAFPFSGNSNTRTTVILSFHGSVWAMDSGSSGASIS